MLAGERLRAARKRAGLSVDVLAKRVRLSTSAVRAHENGQNDFSPAQAKLYAAMVKTTADLLLYGPDEEFEQHIGNTSDEPDEHDVRADMPELVEVPEYDVQLSAGGGFVVDQETTKRNWPLPRFLVVDQLGLSTAPGNITIQEVIGDSMLPTLQSGDYALIDLRDQRIGLPGVFAIWDGDALVCKRVERIPGSEPSEVRLKSDNPLHGEYRVLEERVRVVGRVRWVTRRM